MKPAGLAPARKPAKSRLRRASSEEEFFLPENFPAPHARRVGGRVGPLPLRRLDQGPPGAEGERVHEGGVRRGILAGETRGELGAPE